MSLAVSARCLRRTATSAPQAASSTSSLSRVHRRYSYAALKTRPQTQPARRQDVPISAPHAYVRSTAPARVPGEPESAPLREKRRKSEEGERPRRATTAEVGEVGIFSEHLNGLFSPLKFPPELSARILTHASHPAAFHGHNAQFAFIGRRVLESYLLLLLTSSPNLKPTHDLQEIVSRVLNTYFLGEHIGSKWGMGRIMRWTPTVPASVLTPEGIESADKSKLVRDIGLFKVQGDAVTAVIGGIFQQFGASVAHRVFHTRVLPRLLLPNGGLPAVFHADANMACARLGGASGQLLLDVTTNSINERERDVIRRAFNKFKSNTMFSGWTRSLHEISIFHHPTSPPSVKALGMLRSALSAPYPDKGSEPLKFNLEVIEGAPTADQLNTILSFLPAKDDSAPSAASVFLSAHPTSPSSGDIDSISRLGRDRPNALKWPIVVDWNAGTASVGDVGGVTRILEELRKKRDVTAS
ncbi:RNase III domain-containing protein [Mycena kentingensis (nom. inval.)]|nr:RNase III domain-containing protein [Mycena kentingensis (nom. inval.)]